DTFLSNCGATTDGPMEHLCSFCCGDFQVNNDVWFSYTPDGCGLVTVSTCASPGASFDTKIAVYSAGCPFTEDTAIACNEHFSSRWSQASFSAVTGHTYLIRVGGYLGQRGGATLSITRTGQCGNPDYNCDGDIGTDADIETFFACLAGSCPPAPCC